MNSQKLYNFVLLLLVLGLIGFFFYHMFNLNGPACIDDIWVINLDRDAERWTHMSAKIAHFGDMVHRFSAMDGKTIKDREGIHKEGVGYSFTLVRGKGDDIINRGVVGCWLSHKRLLTHLADQEHQNNYGHLILEDDVTIPNDFLSGTDAWSRISKNIPGDWDIVYLGMNGDVEGSPIANNIVKLSPYKKGQWGTYAYVVKHGSIKTKLLPALRFMTDSIDEQYNTLFGDINAYCIRPSLIRPNEEVCNTSSIDT